MRRKQPPGWKSSGMRILEKNYRCREGEIDLVAMDGSYLVFVEVKYRRDQHAGHPAEAVDARKQRKIVRTAMCTIVWNERFPRISRAASMWSACWEIAQNI